jgi:hypothetical protein
MLYENLNNLNWVFGLRVIVYEQKYELVKGKEPNHYERRRLRDILFNNTNQLRVDFLFVTF